MKQAIILWTAAIVITFLAGYIQSISGEYYPVTGTIGIEGEKASYLFDKIYRGKNNYSVVIRTEKKNLNGKLLWREKNSEDWNIVKMKHGTNALAAEIPKLDSGTEIEYKVEITYKEKVYSLLSEPVKLKFLGYVPPMVMILFNLALFGGLLLSTRTGLEYFKEKNKIKKYSLFTVALFFIYAIVLTPLKNSYQLEAINSKVPGLTELFNLQPIVILVLWITGMVLIFKLKKSGLSALIISVITLLVFILIRK